MGDVNCFFFRFFALCSNGWKDFHPLMASSYLVSAIVCYVHKYALVWTTMLQRILISPDLRSPPPPHNDQWF